MIKKILPYQQHQNSKKASYQQETKVSKMHFTKPPQIQSQQIKLHINNQHFLKNDHVGKANIIQSRYDQRKIQKYDEQKFLFEVGGYFSHSQNKSQVISINELQQHQPTLMSNINYNFKRNFRKPSQTKIKNSLEELRAVQTDFIEYVNDQKAFISEQIKKISDYLIKKVKSASQNLPKAELMQQIFQKNKLIGSFQVRIEQKEEEISRLKKELKSVKSSLQRQQQRSQQLQKMNSKKSRQRGISNYQSQYCSNCQILQIKYDTLKQETSSLAEIRMQNESLQEYIFDLEQRIVGIDIEVQARVKKHVKQLQKTKSNKLQSNQLQTQNYIEILRKLNDQNARLQQKCDHLQRNTIKQHQIRQWQKRLLEKEIDYGRKESQLFQSLARHQKDKQKLYEKQHYLLISEQQISNKIQILTQKQAQLNEWQSMLNQSPIPNVLPSIQRHQHNMEHEDYQINEAAINSFGRIQQHSDHQNDPVNQLQRNLSQHIFIPQLQIHKHQSQPYFDRNYQKQIERPNVLSPKSAHQSTKVYTEIIRKQQNKGPNFQMKKKNEILAYQRAGSRREKSNENPSAKSPKNYRESSKSSKISTNKGNRNIYLAGYSTNQKVGLRQNTQGWTNKLDRLRQQIKREIKSIV